MIPNRIKLGIKFCFSRLISVANIEHRAYSSLSNHKLRWWVDYPTPFKEFKNPLHNSTDVPGEIGMISSQSTRFQCKHANALSFLWKPANTLSLLLHHANTLSFIRWRASTLPFLWKHANTLSLLLHHANTLSFFRRRASTLPFLWKHANTLRRW